MGCIQSSEAAEDGPTSAPAQGAVGGEVYVYVPGLRTPKYVDLKELLQGSVSADLAARLQLLRSQVLVAAGKNTPASKSIRRRLHQQGMSQARTFFSSAFAAKTSSLLNSTL
jgi:hypothetical protein